MQPISYARHQFPADIIRHAVWLYRRFTLSYRDVKEFWAERVLLRCRLPGMEQAAERRRPALARIDG